MAGGVDRAPPKLLAAVGDYADGIGPAPVEIVDVTLAERFGWTWTELNEQDMSQVLPAVAASNIYAALKRVTSGLERAALGNAAALPSEDDLRIWRAVTQAQDERDA